DPVLVVRPRRHAREPDRRPVPGRRIQPPAGLALLPGCDSARDRPAHEPRGADHRQALRVPPNGGRLMSAVQPSITLQGDRRVRRRKWGNRLAEGLATLAALAAILVLAIVVWS